MVPLNGVQFVIVSSKWGVTTALQKTIMKIGDYKKKLPYECNLQAS